MPWSSRPPLARSLLARWLTVGGSLSARLNRCAAGFHVQRQRQGRRPLPRHDLSLLRRHTARPMLGDQTGWSREVLLRDEAQPLVAARSFALRQSTLSAWRSVKGLGQRPLADLLFTTRRVRRLPLTFQCVKPQDALGRRLRKQLGEHQALPLHARIWARRSVFVRHGQPLVVEEYFLPALAVRQAPGEVAWHQPRQAPGLRGDRCR